jgi:hypothetical protein
MFVFNTDSRSSLSLAYWRQRESGSYFKIRSSGQNAQGEREEERPSYFQNSTTTIIHDAQQTSSDLSRTVFLTWCDKYNILQFSLFYSISVRVAATASAHCCCCVLVCSSNESTSHVPLSLARVRVNQILCLNWSLTNCVSISSGDENDGRLQCAVNLVAIDRLVHVSHQRTILWSCAVNQPWCKSNLLLFAARIHTFVLETVARAIVVAFLLFVEAKF